MPQSLSSTVSHSTTVFSVLIIFILMLTSTMNILFLPQLHFPYKWEIIRCFPIWLSLSVAKGPSTLKNISGIMFLSQTNLSVALKLNQQKLRIHYLITHFKIQKQWRTGVAWHRARWPWSCAVHSWIQS